jgi:peptidoglycan/xylan/chitin deacetylase (PgdA/CDA1 family)
MIGGGLTSQTTATATNRRKGIMTTAIATGSTIYPRQRIDYSSPFTRPALKLPGKGRLIVWSVVNIEEWEITRPMARQLSPAPQGQSAIPDMPNWTWYEYGMRVGFWRLMRALKKAKVAPTMSINARVCEVYPEVTAAARDAGWEFMAHCYVQMPIQQIADRQAEVMRQSIDIIRKATGKPPSGWLGPGRGQMFDTPEHIARAGFSWFGDWVLDDQPVWVRTANGPILSIPYSAEINDITMMISHHHESDVLLTRTRDAFDRLYQESKESTRVMAIGVHPYVSGQSHRIKYYEQLYAYINKHPGVVHWTGQQIHDWYVKQVPKPKGGIA